MAKKGVVGILSYLLLSLGLSLVSPNCVDPEEDEGNTGGTSLYVFDAGNGVDACRVLVYRDVAMLFEDADTPPTPDREMSGPKIDRVRDLGWGGLCFDPNGNRLYLVSEKGDVVRIEYARTQDGLISNLEYIKSFQLGASDSERLSNGKFGQASLDSVEQVLYVTETNSSDARVWVVKNPQAVGEGESVSNSDQIYVPGDKGGTGVAAHNRVVYAYFDDGSNIPNPMQGTSYTGPRLRRGSSSMLPPVTSLIIGDSSDSVNRTQLAKYGCLAVDMEGEVYLARHLNDSGRSGNAILYFKRGTFNTNPNQPPDDTFGDARNLRVISHAVTRDWLAGAQSNGDIGLNTLWLWKTSASSASRPSKYVSLEQNIRIRGLALDGAN